MVLKKTQGDQVIELLKTKQVPLEYGEIDEELGFGRSLYTVLDRLVDRKLISKRRSHNNPKRFVYLISNQSQEETIKNVDIKESTPHTPLPSSNSSGDKIENSKPITNKETEISQQVSQQLVNTTESNKVDVSSSNQDLVSDSALVNNFSENQGGGGNINSVSTENDVNSNCETDGFVENDQNEPPKLTGLIVYHLDNPEIKGVIQSEPYRTIGISWKVDVEWDEPRPCKLFPNMPPEKNETITITCLASEEQEVQNLLNRWFAYDKSLLGEEWEPSDRSKNQADCSSNSNSVKNDSPSSSDMGLTQIPFNQLIEKAKELNEALKDKILRTSSYYINQVKQFLSLDWLVDYDSEGYPIEVYQF